MKKLLFLLFALITFQQSEAQTTRSGMLGYNATTFTNCGTNCITGTELNIWNATLVNSAGFLQDTNVWTGKNIFNNTLQGAINLTPSTSPSAPIDGDLWASSTGLFTRIGGVSYNLINALPVITGDCTLALTVLTCTKTNGTAFGNLATLSTVTNSKLATMPAKTIKGNSTGASNTPSDLSPTQVQGILNTAQCVNFVGDNIGGVGDGTADNASAWSNAFAALGSYGGCIYIPHGKYYSSTSNSFTYPATAKYSVTIVGDGPDTTVLYWNTTNGLTINAKAATQSLTVKNLTFSTNAAGTFTALSLNSSVLLGIIANSEISHVTFRGDDGGGATNYWATAINNVGWPGFNYIGDVFYGNTSGSGGVGISVAGNASISPYYNIIHNVIGCNFLNIGLGFNYGTYVQGVTISQTLFVNGAVGIKIPAGAVGATQLTLTADEFNTTGTQVDIEAPLATFSATNNLVYVLASQTGFLINGAIAQSTITGNSFAALSSSGSTAINVSGSASYSLINSNEFYNFANGIIYGASSAKWLTDSNIFSVIATPITNSGTNNRITNNTGYNPVGVFGPINTGTSGSYITAGSSPETHYITQIGSYNATIYLGSTLVCYITSNTACTVNLGPFESYGVLWTTTQPTYVKSIH